MNKKKFHITNKQNFRFLFVGDTSFGENYQEKIKERGGKSILDQHGYGYGFKNFKSMMVRSNFVIMNLETPITNCKISPFEGQKKYIHWTDVDKAPNYLLEHNVSLVSLANNHSYDYGEVGFNQTLDLLNQAKLPFMGAGRDIYRAAEPFICELNFVDKSIKIAIIAAFECLPSYKDRYKVYANTNSPGLMPLDEMIIKNQIDKIKAQEPEAFIILFPHWGSNYKWCQGRQEKLAKKLFAHGVDLIIGHGAHMIQEFSQNNGKINIYSLGNFVFNSPGRYQYMEVPPYSAVASLDIAVINNQPALDIKLYPIITDNRITGYQSRFVNKQEFEELSEIFTQRPIMQNYKNFAKANKDNFGYYFQIPIDFKQKKIKKHEESFANEKKWIGMIYHQKHNLKIEKGIFNLIMDRASVLTPELIKHNYNLICYFPASVDKEKATLTGYVWENNAFRKAEVKLPTINHDFHIGASNYDIYVNFQSWALDRGYKIYPTKAIRLLSQDKLKVTELISQFDKSIITKTAKFDGSESQIQEYLQGKAKVFIKPRFGSQGNDIMVVKFHEGSFIVEYYLDKEKHSLSFANLLECVSYINSKIDGRRYIIQEAIDVMRYEESVFDIRTLLFNVNGIWHFMSEIRFSKPGYDVSNAGYIGKNEIKISMDFLEKLFSSRKKAELILARVKLTVINLAEFISREYNETINELGFDILLDKNENIYIAEKNTKSGLAGLTIYKDFFNMTDYEKYLHENLSIQHGKLLARSLISREREIKKEVKEEEYG